MADAIKSHRDPESISLAAAAIQRQSENLRHSRCLQPRQGVDSRAVIRLINLAADVHGRVVDISFGGCHIRTDRRFPVGVFRRVEVEFCIDGLSYRFAGVTQAIYDPINVGIRFLDLSERKREQLLQLINEIRESESTEEPKE